MLNNVLLKRIRPLFLMLCFLFPLISWAQDESTLTVYTSDYTKIKVAINKRLYAKTGTKLTIGNLPPGQHNIKVYRADMSVNNPSSLIYSGYVKIVPGKNFELEITKAAAKVKSSGYHNTENEYAKPDVDYSNDYDDQHLYEDDVYVKKSTPKVSTTIDAMTAAELKKLSTRMHQDTHDTVKLRILQNALDDKTYTTAQTAEMIQWLNFDFVRYKFVSWSYPRISDKANIKSLREHFLFDATKKTFDEWLSTLKK